MDEESTDVFIDKLGNFDVIAKVCTTRSSSRFAALLLGPCGAGTLASRAGGPSAPMGGLRPPGITHLILLTFQNDPPQSPHFARMTPLNLLTDQV